MTDTNEIVVEAENGPTIVGPSIEQLQQLIGALAEPDNLHLTVSTGTTGLEPWHIIVSLDPDDDGWYQVGLQNFTTDEDTVARRHGVAATAADVMDLVAQQLASHLPDPEVESH